MSTSLEQQWKDRLEAYASSGLTKTAFCRKHDIPYISFIIGCKNFNLLRR